MIPRRAIPSRALLPLLASCLALLALTAACASKGRSAAAPSGSPQALSVGSPAAASATAARGATDTPPAAAVTAAATSAPATSAPPPPAQTPPPASAAPPAPSSAEATPTPILITVPTPPPPDYTGCKPGQIKGDKATKAYYLPGMIGYNDLSSNVDCFNTIDAATGAGYHLPSP